jgi:hypothetical protein
MASSKNLIQSAHIVELFLKKKRKKSKKGHLEEDRLVHPAEDLLDLRKVGDHPDQRRAEDHPDQRRAEDHPDQRRAEDHPDQRRAEDHPDRRNQDHLVQRKVGDHPRGVHLGLNVDRLDEGR